MAKVDEKLVLVERELKELREEVKGLGRAVSEHVGSHREELAGLEGYKDLVRELKKQNSELHDRLMAREYPELKRFSLPEEMSGRGGVEVYDPLADEELSGGIFSQEDLDELSPKGEDGE